MKRRTFVGMVAGGIGAGSLTRTGFSTTVRSTGWNAGQIRHILPAADHQGFLIKCSTSSALASAPILYVGNRQYPAIQSDSRGRFWQFRVEGLAPASEYRLRLESASGTSLCDPWPLRTFPAPDEDVSSLKIVTYTCAGGHEDMLAPGGIPFYQPLGLRQAYLDAALAHKPDVLIANGDHIYWDLKSYFGGVNPFLGSLPDEFRKKYGQVEFDRRQRIMGTSNEDLLTKIADHQIADLYGTRCRSTPVFFVADDHDYFENDEGRPNFVTFPPEHFNVELQRACQHLYYPEFLPSSTRPLTLPGSDAGDRWQGVSECFGTLRYGRLFEALIYDCGRYMSLKGRQAGLVPAATESWLLERTASLDTQHLMHVPSHPMGWSAGKWREWYPDLVVGDLIDAAENARPVIVKPFDKRVTNPHLSKEYSKYLWQQGWWSQHQRLLGALANRKNKAGVIVSGDLHASAWGRITRSADLVMAQPVTVVLAGSLGSADAIWPSFVRNMKPSPPSDISMTQQFSPVEENGFTVIEIEGETMTVKQWVVGDNSREILFKQLSEFEA